MEGTHRSELAQAVGVDPALADERPDKQTFRFNLLHGLAVVGRDVDANFALECIQGLPLGRSS